ncbi:hypothetical protein ON064_08375 [Planococcus sp. A6]|uniref:hypothetical protein n=1 Tax=Planococcus sp. A6 TaxID=2992760 RepID=UPI00237BC4B3|nr:hypothetical protein [Planococcus sp. A6]MDE0583051.1 hypothetical protein [Planococcus sp. A6]
MKVRIGAIGPADSIEVIRQVAALDKRIELVEFEYSATEQLPDILKKHRYEVTQWIFSGPIPYDYCIENELITPEEAAYPPLHGMALLGTCLQAMHEHDQFIKHMSLDIVDESIVQSLFSEYQLNNIKFELHHHAGTVNYQEIIDFHINNYRSGKTKVALTCLAKVYWELTSLGIPCYRVKPSKLAIQTIFNLLVSRAKSHVYEKQKVAVVGFELLKNEKMPQKADYSFYEREKELEFEQELLQITKKLNGSLIHKGRGIYFIYTTQGDYELLFSPHSIMQIAKEISMRTSLSFHIGIGSGYTIHGAELNVQTAFEHVSGKSEMKAIYVDESGIIEDLAGSETMVDPKNDSQLPEYWIDILTTYNYRITIPAKIYQYVKLKNIPYFSSDLITGLLKSSERNSRRILNEMEQMGLIREAMEEQKSGKRGRPKKVYEFILSKGKQES